MSAEQRIRELEEGIEPEFVKVITDGNTAASIMVEFARSVKKNAKIILPDTRAMDTRRKAASLEIPHRGSERLWHADPSNQPNN